MKRITISLLIIVAFISVEAQKTQKQSILQLNAITTAVPFLLIAPDSRAGALGDAGVASSPDANSMHWNAAKMAYLKKDMGVSISYSPWLRNLVPDINLSYVSVYKKIGKNQTLGSSLRYFSLGNIQFTDENGQPIGNFNPNEFAFDVGYARKLGDKFSGGIVARYIYSDLTGGISSQGSNTKAGKSFAVDISGFYTNPDVTLFNQKTILNVGMNISNIGAKISYTADAVKDFLPINLRLGQALTFVLDDYNSLTFLTDFNKLLVPTPPVYATTNSGQPIIDPQTGKPEIALGRDPNVPIVTGILQSFTDAPYGFKEELREYNISVGLEYVYNKQFAVRTGYFNEDASKGNRKYFTVGAGLKMSVFSVDFSYLISVTQNNPLANTVRFSLMFDFEAFKKQNKGAKSSN